MCCNWSAGAELAIAVCANLSCIPPSCLTPTQLCAAHSEDTTCPCAGILACHVQRALIASPTSSCPCVSIETCRASISAATVIFGLAVPPTCVPAVLLSYGLLVSDYTAMEDAAHCAPLTLARGLQGWPAPEPAQAGQLLVQRHWLLRGSCATPGTPCIIQAAWQLHQMLWPAVPVLDGAVRRQHPWGSQQRMWWMVCSHCCPLPVCANHPLSTAPRYCTMIAVRCYRIGHSCICAVPHLMSSFTM